MISADDDLSRCLDANYSISATETFIRFAKHAIRSSCGLDVLRHCCSRPLEGLPSWCPDWSAPVRTKLLWHAMDADSRKTAFGINSFECLEELEEIQTESAIIFRQVECPLSHYNASAGEMPHFIITEDGNNTLQCSGLICDEIEMIHELFVENATEPWENATKFMTAVSQCKSLVQQCTGGPNPYKNACGRLKAFWRTLMADHTADDQYRPYLGEEYLRWLPPLPKSWTSDVMHNVTTRPEIHWRNKHETTVVRQGFAHLLRQRDIQVNGFSWSDFEVESIRNLLEDIVSDLIEDMPAESPEGKLIEGLIENPVDDFSPYDLMVAAYQIANWRSPEIFSYHGSYEQYLLDRWDLQDQMVKVSEMWSNGPHDLIDSPFNLLSVVPDPYERERKDPGIKIGDGWMEDEAVQFDPTQPKRKIKCMPADDAIGYAGEKGREKYALGRRFFVTKEGYFGLAPAATREIDMVAVLFGSTVPMILKSQPGNTFELIGETHVQGIMDGEIVVKMRAEGTMAQSISIV